MNEGFLRELLSGAIVMGYLVAGLLFLRFWSRTRDRLFLFFSLAFWLLGVHRLLIALDGRAAEYQVYSYVLRLLSYGLILFALYEKNRKRPSGAAEGRSRG